MILFLVYLSAVADRVRGDAIRIWFSEANHRLPAYLMLGWVFAALSGYTLDWLTLPIMLAIVAGASPGLSHPMGALLNGGTDPGEPEWWQVGILKTNALLACIVRGAMWGLPVSLLAYFDHRLIWALPAYAIAFPSAILIARYLFKSDWEKAEFLRGGIAAGLFIGLQAIAW